MNPSNISSIYQLKRIHAALLSAWLFGIAAIPNPVWSQQLFQNEHDGHQAPFTSVAYLWDVRLPAPKSGQKLSEYLREHQLLPWSQLNGQRIALNSLWLQRHAIRHQAHLRLTQLKTALAVPSSGDAQNQQESVASKDHRLLALAQHWVTQLQPVSRLVLPSTDADVLALKPEWNPILEPGDELHLAELPTSWRLKNHNQDPKAEVVEKDRFIGQGHVLLLGDFGSCVQTLSPGTSVKANLLACPTSQSHAKALLGKAIDEAWLIQPDGQVHHISTGMWGAHDAPVPVAGSVILAPSRNSGLNQQTAGHLADVMAAQPLGQLWAMVMGEAILGDAQTDAMPKNPLHDSRTMPATSNTWGMVGLLQTPTARMRTAGTASVTATRVAPYSRYSIILQPFDWLEGGFRYNKITNVLYGPVDFSGDQKFLDKNIDFKLRLFSESAYTPEVAVGFQDIGGTGLFSGEYLVASKRLGSIDASLGLGFGYLGTAADTQNPLRAVAASMNVRGGKANVGQGGEVNASDFFRGPAAFFGGLQWHTPWRGLVLNLEYEGNNYSQEPFPSPDVVGSSRLNYGLVYRASDSVNLHVGVERGNTLSVGLSLFENLSRFNTPKISDPTPMKISEHAPAREPDWAMLAKQVAAHSSWDVTRIERRGLEVRVVVNGGRAAYLAETLERVAEVLHTQVPEEVLWFSVVTEKNGTRVAEHSMNRAAFVARRSQYGASQLASNAVQNAALVKPGSREFSPTPVSVLGLVANAHDEVNQPKSTKLYPEQSLVDEYPGPVQTLFEEPDARFKTKVGLGYRQVLGGADGLLYQFVVANDTHLRINKSTWLDARLAYRVLDNFEKYKQTGNSRLPQVRTNMREYAVTSEFTIPRLNLHHQGRLADGHYYALYGGLLESMFGGVGAEYLYRPNRSRWALGVDVNSVRQRGFEQDFEFQNYRVNTGHATLYWDTGLDNILATISAGQYLAGDRGVTLDLSREFNNGVRMGVFATRTNVPAEVFGEGSFDKGIYVTIPFNAFFTKSIPGDAMFLWRPLTRDGGAKLGRPVSLYADTENRNPRLLQQRPGRDFE